MNIIIPGVMRCGTTSLRRWLSLHPAIRQPKRREIEYFSSEYHMGPAWYQMQLTQGGLDKSPNYMADPEAPRRIAKDLPDAKIVMLLRDPVERAWSHYRWIRQHKPGDDSFLRAASNDKSQHGWYSVLRRGHYAEQLSHWFKLIPREQILVVKSEELWQNPEAAYREIIKFLNLTPFTPSEFRRYGTLQIVSEIKEGDREFLVGYYRSHNEKLYELLGRDMEWQK